MNRPAISRSWIPRLLKRLLLALAMAILVSSGCTYMYAQRRLVAIAYVEDRGGQVDYARRPKWYPRGRIPDWLHTVDGVSLQTETVDLRRLEPLHEMTHMTFIGCDFEGERIQRIGRFRKLDSLTFWSTDLRDADLTALRGCDHLESLAISNGPITDAGLAPLAKLPLTELSLQSTRITDAGLVYLAGCPLESLDLSANPITGAGLSHLAHLPLVELGLEYTQITDEGLRNLPTDRLGSLDLTWTGVGDAGLKELLKLPLTEIRLTTTNVTFEGVLSLRAIPTLESCTLGSPPFTTEQQDQLRKAGVPVTVSSLPIGWPARPGDKKRGFGPNHGTQGHAGATQ